MIRIFAYNRYSESARRLAEEMDVYLIRHEGSRYRPRQGHTVINWGRGRNWGPAITLNPPHIVERVVNKRTFFVLMEPDKDDTEDAREYNKLLPRIPEFTTDREVARTWLGRDCRGNTKKVVVRRILNGHEGRGIEIHETPENIPLAPLYVRYIPKSAEYRIHIVGSNIIDRQRKVLRASVPRDTANWGVRNTANGFIFQRQGIVVPQDVETQALLAVRASGLDFAAADVIWNERRQQAYVLELNTAPGIEGTTVSRYAEALRNYVEELH
jgi:hypothetical protein